MRSPVVDKMQDRKFLEYLVTIFVYKLELEPRLDCLTQVAARYKKRVSLKARSDSMSTVSVSSRIEKRASLQAPSNSTPP